jgi:hypothetical protein
MFAKMTVKDVSSNPTDLSILKNLGLSIGITLLSDAA